MTELQNLVIKKAKKQLKKLGCNKICLDYLPKTDKEIEETGIEQVIQVLVADTIYWER